jgi:Cytochrome c oxidase subunit VIa
MFSAEAHDAEHAAVTATWKKRTFMALPVLAALSVANVLIHMSHGHHDHHVPHYAYERKLVKKYPWKEHECNLFDYDCKHAAYNKATGKGGHH